MNYDRLTVLVVKIYLQKIPLALLLIVVQHYDHKVWNTNVFVENKKLSHEAGILFKKLTCKRNKTYLSPNYKYRHFLR